MRIPPCLVVLRETLLAELQVPNASAVLAGGTASPCRKCPPAERGPPTGGFRRQALSFRWKRAGHGEPGKHGD